MLLLGDSGSGKSALLANWVAHWRQAHPNDFIFQHYIGGTADSADHWRLMSRLMAEIKRWSGDPETVPTKHDDILRDFPLWLAKARARAGHEGVRFIVVLDALNQLEDHDHARLLGWLPEHPFTGPLRLIVSTLPGQAGADDPLAALQPRHWPELRVQPLTVTERRRMIADYLARFGKKLDEPRLERLAAAPPAANPLYLKILLDDLRVTGTHERLDERLTEYLAAPDIPVLLKQVLTRYQRDYERDRPGLVSEALGLIWAARRGLTETELLQLLRPKNEAANQTQPANPQSAIGNPQSEIPQLPPALWTPLRAALEDSLVDRGGILNFAHDFLRTAVSQAFAPDEERCKALRLQLAYYFEAQPITPRTSDELPWLLWHTNQRERLRACLLDIERFLEIKKSDQEELMHYWVWLEEERTMGTPYLTSFEAWSGESGCEVARLAHAANELALFLSFFAALHAEAECLYRQALALAKQRYGLGHPQVGAVLNNLGQLLRSTSRLSDAEPLYRQAVAIDEQNLGPDDPNVAIHLNNLARLLQVTNRVAEAEPLMRRALVIDEQSYGPDHPNVARDLNNLATLLHDTNRLREAESLMRRALAIDEKSYGSEHPTVAIRFNNLALLLKSENRLAEAEPLMRQAAAIWERALGNNHPKVAIAINNLALLLLATNRLAEAEPLMRRAMAIDEQSHGANHPDVASVLNNLSQLLQASNRLVEAEPLLRRALAIDEQSFGPEHPEVATVLSNLAQLLVATSRVAEAEPLMRRALAITEQALGADHPNVATTLSNLAELRLGSNRLVEAAPLMRRAVKILQLFNHKTGHEHPYYRTCRARLRAVQTALFMDRWLLLICFVLAFVAFALWRVFR